MAIFYLLDANSDVYLDRGELHGMPDQTFDAADLEQDGRPSGFEFIRARSRNLRRPTPTATVE
jgi:hypothetical protein